MCRCRAQRTTCDSECDWCGVEARTHEIGRLVPIQIICSRSACQLAALRVPPETEVDDCSAEQHLWLLAVLGRHLGNCLQRTGTPPSPAAAKVQQIS